MIRRLSGRSDSVRAWGWEIPALLSVIGLTAGWTAWLQLRPGVLPGSTHADSVDAAVLRADLEAIVGDGTPRVVGTPGAAAGRDRIAGILESLGLQVERQRTRIERRAGTVDVENMVATVDGSGADDAPAIAVVAHSDSVPGSPGASDDGAGVAVLCAVARALAARPPVHDVLLLVTDGEERGLLGAQAFMAQHPAAASLRAVVNLDARGASGPAAIFELGPESDWLAGIIADFVPAPRTQSLAAAIYGRMPNGTDFTVFLKSGASGFNIAFIGDVAAYHRPEDTVARQSPWTRAHMAETALALVRGLDARWPGAGPIPAGRAVFGDVLGAWVLRWPEPWTPWLVGAAVLAIATVGLRSNDVRAGSIARALVACLAVVVASAAVGWILATAASAARIDFVTAPVRAWAVVALGWLAAALMAVGTGTWLARRSAPWEAVLGAWATWFAPTAAAAVVLPSTSLLLSVPLVAASVAGVLCGLRRSPGAGVVAVVGASTAVILWMPLEPLFVDALGISVGPFTGLRAGLVSMLAVPVVAMAARRAD